jgi:hypothetical protein
MGADDVAGEALRTGRQLNSWAAALPAHSASPIMPSNVVRILPTSWATSYRHGDVLQTSGVWTVSYSVSTEFDDGEQRNDACRRRGAKADKAEPVQPSETEKSGNKTLAESGQAGGLAI